MNYSEGLIEWNGGGLSDEIPTELLLSYMKSLQKEIERRDKQKNKKPTPPPSRTLKDGEQPKWTDPPSRETQEMI